MSSRWAKEGQYSSRQDKLLQLAAGATMVFEKGREMAARSSPSAVPWGSGLDLH